jgi:hypothetical protein
LAEEIATGHAAMPQFVFQSDQVGAIIAYLKILEPQVPEASSHVGRREMRAEVLPAIEVRWSIGVGRSDEWRKIMRSDSDIKRDVENELRWSPNIDDIDIAVAVTRRSGRRFPES